MDIEKERLSNKTFMPSWVRREHDERFKFASRYVLDKVVADCACGAGFGTEILAKSGAKRIYAYDISEDAINEARANNKFSNIEFQVSDALGLPIPNGSIDIFISLETIEHLNDNLLFLTEVNRVLKQDGTFICSTPNRVITNPGKSLGNKPCNKFHIREYSQDEFESLLKKHFVVVELFGQNPNNKYKVKIFYILGIILPFDLATRLHQFWKLIYFLLHFRKYNRHKIRKIVSGHDYELITALCRK